MPLILPSNSISAGGYDVANSLRFNGGSSDYLNRTNVASPTNQFKWTFSFWVKLSDITDAQGSGNQMILSDFTDASNRGTIFFEADDTLVISDRVSGSFTHKYITNRLFRDVSAWYHIVVNHDRTLASPATKVFVNGVQETSFGTSTDPSQNGTSYFNKGGQGSLVGKYGGGSEYYNGYLSEAVWIDGQVLDADQFGEFDEDSPTIWKPKDVSGLTFGTNGFYLDFENSGSLGADVSGNGNNFTVNNLTSIDQTTDTPTNNYSTLNPLDRSQSTATYSEGNLKWTTTSGYFWGRANIGVSSGKWYFEAKLTSAPEHAHVGIVDEAPIDNTDSIEGGTYNWGYKNSTGYIWNNNSGSSYGSTYTTGDIIGVYLDLDNNKLYFAKNGTIQNSGTGISITDTASTNTGNYFFAVGDNASATNGTWEANFGNPSFSITSGNSDPNGYGNFEYDPSAGTFDGASKSFYALNTKNLAEYG